MKNKLFTAANHLSARVWTISAWPWYENTNKLSGNNADVFSTNVESTKLQLITPKAQYCQCQSYIEKTRCKHETKTKARSDIQRAECSRAGQARRA